MIQITTSHSWVDGCGESREMGRILTLREIVADKDLIGRAFASAFKIRGKSLDSLIIANNGQRVFAWDKADGVTKGLGR